MASWADDRKFESFKHPVVPERDAEVRAESRSVQPAAMVTGPGSIPGRQAVSRSGTAPDDRPAEWDRDELDDRLADQRRADEGWRVMPMLDDGYW